MQGKSMGVESGRSLMFTIGNWQGFRGHWGDHLLFLSLGWFSVVYFRCDAEQLLSQTAVHATGLQSMMDAVSEGGGHIPQDQMIEAIREGLRSYLGDEPGEGVDRYIENQNERGE